MVEKPISKSAPWLALTRNNARTYASTHVGTHERTHARKHSFVPCRPPLPWRCTWVWILVWQTGRKILSPHHTCQTILSDLKPFWGRIHEARVSGVPQGKKEKQRKRSFVSIVTKHCPESENIAHVILPQGIFATESNSSTDPRIKECTGSESSSKKLCKNCFNY